MLKVIDDLFRSKILIFQDSLGVTVSKEDTWDVIDKSDVVLVDNQVVDCIAISHLWLADVLWIDPLAANLDWVLVGKLEASDLAKLSLVVLLLELEEASDFSSSIHCGDLVTFLDLRDWFGSSISHLDH